MIQLNFHPFPELTSQRLRLRRLIPADEQEIFSLRSDERVNLYLDRKPAESIEDAQQFIEKINLGIDKNESVYWAICLKENPKLIGTICCFNISKDSGEAEIGYELLPFYQKKGIMHEAISIVIHFGFTVMRLTSIIAFPSNDNLSSIKLLERIGFKRDEHMKNEINGGQVVRYELKGD